MARRAILFLFLLTVKLAEAQNTAPNVSQVLMYSATAKSGVGIPSGSVPGVYTYSNASAPAHLSDFSNGNPNLGNFAGLIGTQPSYTLSNNLANLNNAFNASIATSLSIIPLSSPASGVISRTDPATGAEIPASSTLGPIFTERAETIGKGKFYLGFSHQDFHFTGFNGQSLNALSILYAGGNSSQIIDKNGAQVATVPATFNIGMDVRLSQNIAFLTYGVTDRFDVSVGLPVIHSSVAARTFNGTIYAGTGFGQPTCWCVDTFTPGSPTLQLPEIGSSSQSKTGFGDLLLRLKGTVIRTTGAVVAIGTDLRFPTGDERNYLGVGATSVKPFVAVSFYSKPLRNGIVISPHFDAGWQFTGKSILGGDLTPAESAGPPPSLAAPFATHKDFLPDVFSWAVGAEVALGRHNTIIADVLGNQIGWIHGIQNTTTQSIPNQSLPTGPNGTLPEFLGGPANPTINLATASGLVGTSHRVSYGQYSGSFGYKARLPLNLVATVNFLVRFDNNGLTARVVPLYGIGYSF